MPILIKRHNNPNRYERILTSDHESRRRFAPSAIAHRLLVDERKKKTKRDAHARKKGKKKRIL